MNEMKRELTEELLQEFQEVQKIVDDARGSADNWTWTRNCSSYLTIYCC